MVFRPRPGGRRAGRRLFADRRAPGHRGKRFRVPRRPERCILAAPEAAQCRRNRGPGQLRRPRSACTAHLPRMAGTGTAKAAGTGTSAGLAKSAVAFEMWTKLG